jgi:signal transduction histidine kinase
VIGLVSLTRDLPPPRELAEGALILAVLIVLSGLLVFLPKVPWTLELALAVVCPLFVWAAARLRPVFTAAATFICAFTIVWTTTFGIGLFGDTNLPIEHRILSAQATILATSFGALILAGLFSERRLHEAIVLEREAKLQQALRVANVMAFDWDVRSDKLRFSENALDVVGLGPMEADRQPTRAELLSRVHPDDRPHLIATASALSPENPSYSARLRYAVPHGELWLEQVGTAQFDSAGRLVSIRGLTANITDRKRIEQEMLHARRSAERADRAKSAFLAAASHDLRQPLQTLRFLQGTLQLRHPEGQDGVLIADIGRSLDTMSTMLSSLLDVNRLEAGNLRPSNNEFAVSEIFKSLASDFTRPAEEKGLQLRLVRSERIVRSDRRLLEQILRNLLSNAIRYTDHGRIVLGCRRAGARIRIEVWDSGVGIAGDQLPHIFDEYYQGPEGSRRGGFGLGLAIVKRLAEILEHRVDVRSVPGKAPAFSSKFRWDYRGPLRPNRQQLRIARLFESPLRFSLSRMRRRFERHFAGCSRRLEWTWSRLRTEMKPCF